MIFYLTKHYTKKTLKMSIIVNMNIFCANLNLIDFFVYLTQLKIQIFQTDQNVLNNVKY